MVLVWPFDEPISEKNTCGSNKNNSLIDSPSSITVRFALLACWAEKPNLVTPGYGKPMSIATATSLIEINAPRKIGRKGSSQQLLVLYRDIQSPYGYSSRSQLNASYSLSCNQAGAPQAPMDVLAHMFRWICLLSKNDGISTCISGWPRSPPSIGCLPVVRLVPPPLNLS